MTHPLARHLVAVPDFPKSGILFKDISVLLRDHFRATIDAFECLLSENEWTRVDAIAGIESRGFILAAALAERRGIGFVPVRKKGKLPPPVVSESYTLEYGDDVLEMKHGEGRLLLIDDVLATGGTLHTAAKLCTRAGYTVTQIGVLLDIAIVPPFAFNQVSARSVMSERAE